MELALGTAEPPTRIVLGRAPAGYRGSQGVICHHELFPLSEVGLGAFVTHAAKPGGPQSDG
jgi:hypothetical protein